MKTLISIAMMVLSLSVMSCSKSDTPTQTPTLQSELNAAKKSMKVPDDVKAIMKKATDTLKASGLIEKAKKTGDDSIDFDLPNAKGGNLKLSDVLKDGPVILTFYRGGWCPYCNIQLQTYQKRLEDFKKAGARLVAISPDLPDPSMKTTEKHSLKFDVLTDKDNTIAKKYGLVFQMGKDLKDLYLKFGIDLKKSQGNDAWELPIPATYVIDKNGKIIYSFLNVDYSQRAEPADIIKALK